MTAPADPGRAGFPATVAAAAGTVATLLAAHQPRASGHYPLAEMLPVLAGQHRILQEAVAAWPGPLASGPGGRPGPFVTDLAALMGFLQQTLVLFHGLTDIPEAMRPDASRIFSLTHLVARRVRDQARRQAVRGG